MLWYTIFRICFVVIFVGLHCMLMGGIILEWSREQKICRLKMTEPLVSVIIAVHNERHRIGKLLPSLIRQNYPAVEYIFVDGASTDGTADMIYTFFAEQAPALLSGQLKIIRLTENPGPNYKQYALTKGIEVAAGALFLFTDADCTVPPHWIQAMVTRMADERTGLVMGPVFKQPGGNSFFHIYQCFDHAIRYMYLVASSGMGAAGGGFGNNLIVRRTALDAIGGYAAVPYSPTEDAALIAQLRSKSSYQIRSAVGADTFVMTDGEASWKALINQTLRWNNGGLFGPDKATRLNFGFLMITISMGIIAIPLLPVLPSLWPLTAAVMLAMAMNTIATLRLFGSVLPGKGLAYIIQCIFTPMYFTFLTILGFCHISFQWKGTTTKQAG
jgi:cellulose synthase/poly-beta-1,6-N-acetylglucosamine synthase-like glycosyltransferase